MNATNLGIVGLALEEARDLVARLEVLHADITAPPAPTAGQVWTDTDRLMVGRTFQIDRIDQIRAWCTILTNSTSVQQRIDAGGPRFVPPDSRGLITVARLERFTADPSRYRLVPAIAAVPDPADQ